jgi:RNA polymerase sigma-70 factor (ECF subfamily)
VLRLGLETEGRLAGDRERTVEELHRKYAGLVYGQCLRMLGTRADADDAVQETFLAAFRGLGSFTYGASHLPWLYRIATNACLKAIRTRRRKGASPLDEPESAPAPERDPVRDIDARRALEELLETLDERGQEILVAHYVAGMDQGQIAEALGISRRAVVKRLSKLRGRAGDLWGGGSSGE